MIPIFFLIQRYCEQIAQELIKIMVKILLKSYNKKDSHIDIIVFMMQSIGFLKIVRWFITLEMNK